jgi:DnaK suppressor protein
VAKQASSKKPAASKADAKVRQPAAESAPAKRKATGQKPKSPAAVPPATKAGSVGPADAKAAAKAAPGPAVKVTPAATVQATADPAGSGRPAEGKAAAVRKAAPRPSPSAQPAVSSENDIPEPTKAEQTRLTARELEEFRQMLLRKRQELIGDVNHLEDEAIRMRQQGGGSSSSMPIHMADIGSDTWEQELTLGLIENERGLLREIDEALQRIEDGTFGICVATGKPITKARLRAKPWAKYCIEYARKRELGLA